MTEERKFSVRIVCFILAVAAFCGGLALVGTNGSGIAAIILFAFLGASIAMIIAIQWTTFKLTMSISERLREVEKQISRKD